LYCCTLILLLVMQSPGPCFLPGLLPPASSKG
jgi:hypothetical protein